MERIEEDKSKIDISKSNAASWGYSRPKAAVQIIEVMHFVKDNKVWSKGKYRVVEIFNDDQIHFEGYWRTK